MFFLKDRQHRTTQGRPYLMDLKATFPEDDPSHRLRHIAHNHVNAFLQVQDMTFVCSIYAIKQPRTTRHAASGPNTKVTQNKAVKPNGYLKSTSRSLSLSPRIFLAIIVPADSHPNSMLQDHCPFVPSYIYVCMHVCMQARSTKGSSGFDIVTR